MSGVFSYKLDSPNPYFLTITLHIASIARKIKNDFNIYYRCTSVAAYH